jgi:hypothetical protein
MTAPARGATCVLGRESSYNPAIQPFAVENQPIAAAEWRWLLYWAR